MTTLLAALDTSPSAAAVLDTALRLGELTGATIEAVHVREGPTESPEWLAAQAGVHLRVLEGPVRKSLLAAIGQADVDAAVLGARATSSGHRRAIGGTALHVLQLTDKPVAVVPPDMARDREPFHRLLVPLEGSEHSSAPIVDTLVPPHRHRRGTRRAPRLHRRHDPTGDGPPEPRPGDVGQRVPRPEPPQRLTNRAAHRVNRRE